jgi:3-hydroxyacyl-CoA dehydrogenase
MYWGEQIGLDKVLAGMKAFQAKMGEQFKPSALLEKLAAEGGKFADAK